MKKRIITTLLCTLIVFSNSNFANEKEQRLTFYYYGWDVLTRHTLSPNDVRDRFKVKLTFSKLSNVESIVKEILEGNVWNICNSAVDNIDVRLVVDVPPEKFDNISFVADRFKLYKIDIHSSQIVSCTQLNEKFMSYFESTLAFY